MGRRPKYSTAKALERKIDAYFADCEKRPGIKKVTKKGRVIEYPYPYSIEGLSLYLGITRETLNQYSRDEKFSDVIALARAKITEQRIQGAMFGTMNPYFTRFLIEKNDKEHYDPKREIGLSGDLTLKGLIDALDGSANKIGGK